MEEFLTDYVKMLAENREVNLNDAQVAAIVNSLQSTDEIWDTLDMYANQEIDNVKGE